MIVYSIFRMTPSSKKNLNARLGVKIFIPKNIVFHEVFMLFVNYSFANTANSFHFTPPPFTEQVQDLLRRAA